MPRSLLVNFFYAPAVGHALEGLRYALGYAAADPDLDVSILLNGATAVEFVECCSFIKASYPVSFTKLNSIDGDPAVALSNVPRDWDYVADIHRAYESWQIERFPGFRAFFEASWRHFQPRSGGFSVAGFGARAGRPDSESPAYLSHQKLRLTLPEHPREAARNKLDGHQAIAVILAGNDPNRYRYPSATSWELMLTALSERYPHAKLLLIGRIAASEDGNRTISRLDRNEVDRLLASVPATIDCFNLPLLEQVALMEASNLLVAPHTGFAFAALCVDTPWLALPRAGQHEYFCNSVPFYSLIPDRERYSPELLGSESVPLVDSDEDGDGPRIPSMTVGRFRAEIPQIVAAAERLIEGRISYEQALAEHFPRVLAAYGGDRSRIYSTDQIAEQYLG
jgi:hypothetical protein